MTSQRLNVLLVEDDEVDREALRRAFKRLGMDGQIVEAGDGQEALEILRQSAEQAPPQRPFLILLDINMPRMNGHEFLRELRSDTADSSLRNAIVFILTTSEAEKDRLRAYDQHVAGYMVKSDYDEGLPKILTMLTAYSELVVFP